MTLSIEQKRQIRIDLFKYELIAHLEMDHAVNWALSGHEYKLIFESIDYFFARDKEMLPSRLYVCEED